MVCVCLVRVAIVREIKCLAITLVLATSKAMGVEEESPMLAILRKLKPNQIQARNMQPTDKIHLNLIAQK
jgi:hypothetical protein